MPRLNPTRDRTAAVLFATLIVVSLLSLAAYQYAELMIGEYQAADSAVRSVQAKALAQSGLYLASRALSDKDTFQNTLNSNPYDNPSVFQGVVVAANSQPRRQGRFSIVAPIDPEDATNGQTFRYGCMDESSKINLNALLQLDSTGQVAHDMLMKLPNMTEEIADAIIDWIDADDEPRANGAESEVYGSMSPPYRCKNGPLDSVEELLLVRGVTPELLFGTDRNHNGIEDPGEDDGNGFDPGWSRYLTVYTSQKNIDSDGNPRQFLNDSSDMATLYQNLITAVGQDMANYIILARSIAPTAMTTTPSAQGGQTGRGGRGGATRTMYTSMSDAQVTNKVQEILQSASQSGSSGGAAGGAGGGGRMRSIASRWEMVNTTISWTVTTGRQQQTITVASPLNDPTTLKEVLPLLFDKTTTQQGSVLPARVNVNTAPREVLAALPGLTDADVQSILDHRPTPGSTDPTDTTYVSVAWLLTEANLDTNKLKTLERYITASTSVYRVQVIGYFDGGGPTARIEAVIDTNNGQPRILMYRDISDLGRGYSVTTPD